eukprot:scaffold4498_cov119-Isochrysis_galbana.AAC.35
MKAGQKQQATEVIQMQSAEAVASMDARWSRDAGSSAYFELSARHRWMFAAAAVGAWGPVVIFGALRNTVYIVYFGAPAGSIGAVGIFMGWWNALNGPFVARWSDAGSLNHFWMFSPVENWGRRAPWLLSGTPVVILGTSLMWLPPSRSEGWLVAWYALCYFLVVNGVTMQLQAYLSSVQELFTTGVARSRAIARQAPFLTAAFLMAGVLPLIVFNFTPDTTAKCCIAPRSGCPTGDLPCVCFRDAEDLHGVSEFHEHQELPPAPPPQPPFLPGLYNATLASAVGWTGMPEDWRRPLDAYSPEYVASCAAHRTDSLPEVIAARSVSCGLEGNLGRNGVQMWRFAIAAGMVAFLGLFALLAVPPARKSPVALADAGAKPLSLLMSMKSTLAFYPFRLFAGIQFLTQCYGTHITSNISLYLIYVIGLGPDELGNLLFVLIATVIATRLASLPLFLWLLKRVHPATIFLVLRLIEACFVPAFFALLKVEWLNTTLLIAGAAVVGGITQSPNDMILHMLMGWLIDEDGVKHNGLRREGMFWACNGVCQHLSEVVIALVLATFSWAGFDPKKCAADQPSTAVAAIEYSFLVGGPVTLLALSLLAYLYPIRGARLAKLQADVAAMEARRTTRMTGRNTELTEPEEMAPSLAGQATEDMLVPPKSLQSR